VSTAAVIKCFAKINLYLDVICRRPDGYHNIETVFQTIDLCDILQVELTPSGIEVACDDPAVPADESNLACRAFLGIKGATDYDGGVRISIEKNIPPGSGFGGGSSNAAATLVALNRMLEAGITIERLQGIAHGLGADVPFFLTGGLAAAWGIGDRIEPLPPLPKAAIVVAIPRDLAVSTAEAYGMLGAPARGEYDPDTLSGCTDGLKSRANALRAGGAMSEICARGSILRNSLEGPVFSRHPEIERLKQAMIEAGAKGALMSGSGSAVFGLAESEENADMIVKELDALSICDCHTANTTDQGWQWVQSA